MSLGTANGYSSVLPDWQDPELFQKNRLPMSTHFTTDGLKISLDGIWRFRWYEGLDSRDMRFFSLDFDDSEWGTYNPD